MLEVSEGLFVGDDSSCAEVASSDQFSVVHARKTCHKVVLGYPDKLDKDHPNYLVFKTDENLYLNIIDAPFPLSPTFGDPMFDAAIKFAEAARKAKQNVLFHCNQGHSRGPSFALVIMARAKEINHLDYEAAAKDFLAVYPEYLPGKGIKHYLENNWTTLMEM